MLSLSLYLSLSLAGKEDVCGHALWRKREGETGREGEREWEREKQGEGERDVEYVQHCLFLEGMTGALAPFSYLVY